MPVLVHLAYSPWSEKARWALDHHHVRYSKIEHLPLVAEPLLRIASREPFKKQSVPRLYVGSSVLGDSLDIARWAEANGTGAKLFPDEKRSAILEWAALSEELLSNGRARLVARMLHNEAALHEALPTPLRFFGKRAVGIARMATRFIQKNHVVEGPSADEREQRMEKVLSTLQRAIAKTHYLLGDFSFADMAMAAGMGFIDVRPETRLGPEQRKAWTEPRLIAAFPDLLAWRDRVYASHR